MAIQSFEFIISSEEAGARLDHFLAAKPGVAPNRSQIKKLIEDGAVTLNDKTTKAHHKLKENDQIKIAVPEPKTLEAKPEKIPLDIVYEDQDLIVVNKKRGLVVHPAAGNYTGTLVNALLYHCKDLSGIGGVIRPGIVHRLDKDTSGLIVAAKNDLAHHALAEQFLNKTITKVYLALVHGVIKEDEGKIEGEIGRHHKFRKKMAVVSKFQRFVRGKEALSLYKVIARYFEYTLVEVTLKTGRTHQIRVHLTSIGHAIVGDKLYGHRREKFNVPGQLLHATKLGFIHPRSKEYVEFKVPMPQDMLRVISILQGK
ncbi:MAG: RluA family pseudouridine synthase [bacterium]